MTLPFWKMHGLGNDFVIIDGRESGFMPDTAFCLRLADRHRSAGYDQLIVLSRAQNPLADLYMTMFNADGTEAGACGNATRCVARLLFEETGKNAGVIQTVAGLLPVSRREKGLYTVDFGPPRLDWDQIPMASAQDTLSVDLGLPNVPPACCVSMGNPHAVFFVPDITMIDLAAIGPTIEHHATFPQRTNVEFAQMIAPDKIRMRVWERGTGITEACGSGSSATLVAAVRRGLSAREADIILDGGILNVAWREADGHVLLTGPAALAYTGVLGDAL